MAHIILLGDSTFDNGAYVMGAPDVLAQLRGLLPEGWTATSLARDGAIAADIARQLSGLPTAASHLVVSVGGNDALGHIGVLEEDAKSIADAITRLAEVSHMFHESYVEMLAAVLQLGLPVALSTIYEPRFPDPRLQRLAVTALSMFNDVITRAAFTRGVPLLDLRLICDEDADYANPIEPSERGGAKIVRSIIDLVLWHDFARRRTEVFGARW